MDRRAALTVGLLVAAAGCGRDESGDVALPAAAAGVDYQLGGVSPLPAGVTLVVRDRAAPPADGAYSICYVNAFQTQPDELAWWRAEHPDLLLRDSDGGEIVDPDWAGEVLLDTSSASRREEIAAIVGAWIDGCAEAGYDAVELDNLDHHVRSDGAVAATDDLALARTLVGRAHDAGLAVAQKNAAELSEEGAAAGFDLAIAEECEVYRECDRYLDAYGAMVIEVEYTDNGAEAMDRACRERGGMISIVQRDRDLVPAGEPGYHYAAC